MNDLLKYKDYYGSVKYSAEDKILFGKIEFINDLVTFEASNVDDLEKEFKKAVDDYIETCKALGKKAQKSFKGQFNVRISPELHRKAAISALKNNISLNKFIESAISSKINHSHPF